MVVMKNRDGGYILGTAHLEDGTANIPKGWSATGRKRIRSTGTVHRVPTLCVLPIQAHRPISYCPPWTSSLDPPPCFPKASSRTIFSLFLATRLSETSPMPSHGTSPTPISRLSHLRQDLPSPHLGRICRYSIIGIIGWEDPQTRSTPQTTLGTALVGQLRSRWVYRAT